MEDDGCVPENRFTLVASTERDLEMLDFFLGTTLHSTVDFERVLATKSSFARLPVSDLVTMLTMDLEVRFSTDWEGDGVDLLAGKDARRALMNVLSRQGPETRMLFACVSVALGWSESVEKGPKPLFESSNERDKLDPRLRMNVASRATHPDTRLCVEVEGRG